MTPLALIAGQGRLPVVLAEHLRNIGRPHRVLALDGFAPHGIAAESFRLEHLGSVLDRLVADGLAEVCFAGAVRRPAIDPAAIDAATAPILSRLAAAMGQGDDGLLRTVIAIFEERGLTVRGPHEAMPALLASTGPLTARTAAPADIADAARARAILDALGPLDIGQACVVAGGHCLGIETLPGTAALLRFVAETRGGNGGVLAKRAKPGQDRRIDLPLIGPDTVAGAVAAGLSGIAVEAGAVLVVDRADVVARADAAGIAVWAE